MVAFIYAFHLYDSIQSIKCIHITDITIQISFPFVLTRAVLVESQVLHLNLSIRCCLLNHLKCERINGKFREKKCFFHRHLFCAIYQSKHATTKRFHFYRAFPTTPTVSFPLVIKWLSLFLFFATICNVAFFPPTSVHNSILCTEN